MSRSSMRTEIEKAFGIKLVTSSAMDDAIWTWKRMYEDEPLWKQQFGETMGLPAAIANEIARLTVMEMDIGTSGSLMGEYINAQLQRFKKKARSYTEYACAKGGVALKPYYNPSKNRLDLTVVQAENFFPTRCDSDKNILGAVFPDSLIIGQTRYTRLERHEMIGNVYFIENKVFAQPVMDMSQTYTIGRECLLTDVPEWKDIQPIVVLRNVEHPLFAYFKMPTANNIESESPLGISVYARSVKSIKEADEHWAGISWEYKSKESAVMADDNMFQHKPSGELSLSERDKRLYRTMDGLKEQIHEYSPQIRSTEMFQRLEKILRLIEFKCNMAYGTISDPTNVDRTATEVKASKQRSFSFVVDVQNSFRDAHEDLIYAMTVLATIYGLAPYGEFDNKFDFDDSVAVDRGEAFREQMQLASAGMIRPEKVTAWYYGITEEEARELLPQTQFTDTAIE